MAKGYLSKCETLQDGSVKASITFPRELMNDVFPMAYQNVDLVMHQDEVEQVNEDTIDSLLRGTDILERLLKVNEEERNALFELIKVYNHAAVDEDRKEQMPEEYDSADRRGDELMEAQDMLLERKMLLGEDEE